MKWSHTTTQTTEARYVSVGRLDTQRVFQWWVQITQEDMNVNKNNFRGKPWAVINLITSLHPNQVYIQGYWGNCPSKLRARTCNTAEIHTDEQACIRIYKMANTMLANHRNTTTLLSIFSYLGLSTLVWCIKWSCSFAVPHCSGVPTRRLDTSCTAMAFLWPNWCR